MDPITQTQKTDSSFGSSPSKAPFQPTQSSSLPPSHTALGKRPEAPLAPITTKEDLLKKAIKNMQAQLRETTLSSEMLNAHLTTTQDARRLQHIKELCDSISSTLPKWPAPIFNFVNKRLEGNIVSFFTLPHSFQTEDSYQFAKKIVDAKPIFQTIFTHPSFKQLAITNPAVSDTKQTIDTLFTLFPIQPLAQKPPSKSHSKKAKGPSPLNPTAQTVRSLSDASGSSSSLSSLEGPSRASNHLHQEAQALLSLAQPQAAIRKQQLPPIQHSQTQSSSMPAQGSAQQVSSTPQYDLSQNDTSSHKQTCELVCLLLLKDEFLPEIFSDSIRTEILTTKVAIDQQRCNQLSRHNALYLALFSKIEETLFKQDGVCPISQIQINTQASLSDQGSQIQDKVLEVLNFNRELYFSNLDTNRQHILMHAPNFEKDHFLPSENADHTVIIQEISAETVTVLDPNTPNQTKTIPTFMINALDENQCYFSINYKKTSSSSKSPVKSEESSSSDNFRNCSPVKLEI